MRRIIKNKQYNTETATKVHEWESTYDVTDFSWYCETLYRKRTGEYFLHGDGGPMSKYARATGMNQWSGGEAIKPLTYDEARDWMEEHADADEYEAEFGEPDEGDSHDLHVLVSSEAWQAISRTARTEGVTVSTIIERMAATL